MKLTTVTLDYVNDLGEVSGVSVYGIGIITCLFYTICAIIGKSSAFLGRKLDRAKTKALEEMKLYAQEMGADGVMNVRYAMSGLSVMAYGTAFRYPENEGEAAPELAPAADETSEDAAE